MPKYLPTLFSTPMVQAIACCRKRKTRRVLKNVPEWVEFFGFDESTPEGFITGFGATNKANNSITAKKHFRNPYGDEGDRLWIRETWRAGCWSENFDLMIIEYKSGGLTKEIDPHEAWGEVRAESLWKQLTDERLKIERNQLEDLTVPMKWRPSIFMPRKVCRTILEITDRRVERLFDITEEDAIAEGAQRFDRSLSAQTDGKEPLWSMEIPESLDQCFRSAKTAFLNYWDKLNEKRGHGTKTLPWVWVVSFKVVCEQP